MKLIPGNAAFLRVLPLLIITAALGIQQPAAAESGPAMDAAATTTAVVGEVTLSIGSSEIRRAGHSLPLAKGSTLQAGDLIHTSGSGHVHVRFIDGALLSVRPQSRLHIQEYRYDPQRPAESLVKFYLETGTVREISGHAAQMARERFRLNTPLAAIGVKGTDFITQANEQSTVVLVNQGAIVLTPLDASCNAGGFGPCQTERSRELADTMAGNALIYSQSAPEPVLQPVTSVKGIERLAPLLQPQAAADSSVTGVVSDSRNPETVLDVIKPAAGLVWGRWARDPHPGDQFTIAFAEALQGNRVTVGDGYYFLFRNENQPALLPAASGQARFRLQGSSAQYRASSNEIYAAKVEDGRLGIDFDRNTFNTQLTLSYPAGPDSRQTTFTASGTLDRQTGILRSDPADPGSHLAGALANDLSQAGYLFSKSLGNDAISGATLWQR